MATGSLMKVKSIAECSLWSILQYFWPVLSNNWSWKPFLVLLGVAVLHRFYCVFKNHRFIPSLSVQQTSCTLKHFTWSTKSSAQQILTKKHKIMCTMQSYKSTKSCVQQHFTKSCLQQNLRKAQTYNAYNKTLGMRKSCIQLNFHKST